LSLINPIITTVILASIVVIAYITSQMYLNSEKIGMPMFDLYADIKIKYITGLKAIVVIVSLKGFLVGTVYILTGCLLKW
jgi:hypothetical protein